MPNNTSTATQTIPERITTGRMLLTSSISKEKGIGALYGRLVGRDPW